MEQYRDFTYYSHMQFENALNIGWGKLMPINKIKELNTSFFENLWLYTNRTFNKVRGVQLQDLTFNNETIKVGMAEIRVIANINGKLLRYAAPDSIMLNILSHKYKPPQEFITAVIEGEKPGSEIYEKFASRYTPQYLWGEDDEYVEYSSKILDSIKKRDLKAFVEILDTREDSLNTITTSGSLLNASILEKATNISLELLARGFNFNKFNAVELNSAIKMGENEIVKYLLENKIIMNFSDPKFNPYFISILHDNIEAVKLLLDSNIDKNIKYSTPFMRNMDALQFALKRQKGEIAKLLS